MNPIVDTVQGFMQGVVKPLLDKFIPDAEQRLQAEQFAAQNLQSLTLGQQDINKEEAKSPSMFVAGWRPFIGWVCGASLAYAAIVHYALAWILDVISIFTGQSLPPLPKPDLGITLEILAGMLGLGGFRTYEKLKGVAAITHK
jgi:hypothetical protein